MSEYKEYTVTTNNLDATNSVWDDMLSPTGSSTIPDRVVEVANPRLSNEKNTSYFLTDEEAAVLKNDPRVVSVEDLEIIPIIKHAFQNADFNKTSTSTGEKGNWGLLRHIKDFNVYGTSTADPGGTYDYVLDGTGVDIVIIDSGIQANHPEFTDAFGNSRVQEIDWYSVSGVTGTMPANFYTDYDGHGTHVAATIAGKNFGWAKNARIYSIKLAGLEGIDDPSVGLSRTDAFDVLIGWHVNKPNSRPTILNNSWGFGIFWHTDLNALSFRSDTVGPFYPITGGSYRGVPWSGSTRDPARGHTGSVVDVGVYSFPWRSSATDADIATCINAGIIVCNSAGNDGTKVDVFNGTDYNNTITTSSGVVPTYYYHRGGSPNCADNYGFEVGSMGTGTVGGLDRKSSFSCAGPGVDIFAAGANIMSAWSSVNLDGSDPYYYNSNFRQDVISGTSMSSPQIAGVCALLKQVHPSWGPKQIYDWITTNAESDLYTTALDNDYTSTTSIWGGYNRILYFPLVSQKYYQIVAS